MTKKIEDTLNLPRMADALKEFAQNIEQSEQISNEVDQMSEALSHANPENFQLKDEEGINSHEREMNEVYSSALKAHQQILDLGFNVETRFAGSILEPAARFLDIALSASKSKSDQKLKTLKIRMDKLKIDRDLSANSQEGIIESESAASFIADRTELLRDLVSKMKNSNTKNND